jgi:hypothetical protein
LDKLQGRHQGLAEEDLLRAQAVRQEVHTSTTRMPYPGCSADRRTARR